MFDVSSDMHNIVFTNDHNVYVKNVSKCMIDELFCIDNTTLMIGTGCYWFDPRNQWKYLGYVVGPFWVRNSNIHIGLNGNIINVNNGQSEPASTGSAFYTKHDMIVISCRDYLSVLDSYSLYEIARIPHN